MSNITTQKCPMCAEQIPADAAFCLYCGSKLGVEVQAAPPPAEPVQPVIPAPLPARKNHASLWIAGTLILVILCAMIGVVLWTQRANIPALSGLFATSTLTATSTLPPTITSTFKITRTPTTTLTPSPTIDPETGVVTGIIQFGSQPFEGVIVKLCTDWLYTCRGTEVTAVTNAQGAYTFIGLKPGEYQFITQTPDQNDETRWEEWVDDYGFEPVIITVSAGNRVVLKPHTVCKHDIEIRSIAIQGLSVTASWYPYPGATGYSFEAQHGPTKWNFSETSISGLVNGPGNYSYQLSANGPDGMCVVKNGTFIVP